MKSKRQTNTTGLKVQFVPATNTEGNRFKITQTNDKKSIVIDGTLSLEIIDFISTILDRTEEIESYSLIVDNTQNKFYLFSLDFKASSFENILNNFKNFKN